MSLYSLTEVCKGCKNAAWHKCCDTFCKCIENHEEKVNYSHGTCKHKKLKEKNGAVELLENLLSDCEGYVHASTVILIIKEKLVLARQGKYPPTKQEKL